MSFTTVGLDLSRLAYIPNRRVYALSIVASKRPSIIADVSSVFAKYGVDILYFISSTVYINTDVMSAVVFADFTDSGISPSKLVQELKELNGVMSVEVLEEIVPGLVVDSYHYPLMVGGFRAIVIPEFTIRGWIHSFRVKHGIAAEVVLWHEGYVTGFTIFEELRKIMKGVKLDKLITIFLKLAQGLGWFIGEITELNFVKSSATIRVYDSFECLIGKREGVNRAYSHFVRGLFSGFFTALFGKEVVAVETQCIAKGDPYCVFVVRPRS